MNEFRDLTKEQFARKVESRGWKFCGYLGYVDIGNGVHVCRHNGGKRLRSQLAYLIAQSKKHNTP